jgi:hypothetical protein
MIDSRAIPLGMRLVVWLGLLEAGNSAALSELVERQERIGIISANQVLLATTTRPWVWTMVSSVNPSEDAPDSGFHFYI